MTLDDIELDDIKTEWERGERAGREADKRALWRTLIRGGWLSAIKKVLHRDDEAELKAWLSDEDKTRHDIIHYYGDETALRMAAHVRCALILLYAKRVVLMRGGQAAESETEQAARTLLTTASQTLIATNATAVMHSPPESHIDMDTLTRELSHWPSGGASELALADKALQLVSERLTYQPPLPASFLRALTAHLIEEVPQRGVSAVIYAPFALVQPGQREKHALAQFVFERLSDGHGRVFLTPEQACLPMVESFSRVLDAVPRAVHAGLDDEDAPYRHCDVRLRVQWLDTEQHPAGTLVTDVLEGNSASGAAAWGLCFAWTGKVPDKEIIVMLQVDNNLGYSGVEGVNAKVEAIKNYGRFDTIVVAGDNNVREARDSLGDSKEIKVVDINTLDINEKAT